MHDDICIQLELWNRRGKAMSAQRIDDNRFYGK